ncbi:MAG: hypothetical protein GXN93_02280 [Candidatus Diapherotrites archaeon]|nr:hypothetical protein [Candidatus Diapherotrites archaeon]
MELAYFERGLRRAVDHAQRLAVDEQDLKELFENKKHVRAAPKKLHEAGVHELIRSLETVDYRPAKFSTPAEELGYVIGMQGILNGEKGVENSINFLKQMKHLPGDVVAEILSRILLPHAIPPIGAIKSPYAYSPQHKILARMKIRAVGNSLPELTATLLKDAEIDKASADEEAIQKRLDAVRRGKQTISEALANINTPEIAKSKLEEHIRRLEEEGLHIHSQYDLAIREIDKGNIGAASTYLRALHYGQTQHEKTLEAKLERIREGNVNKGDVWDKIMRSGARLALLGLAQELDLGNKTAIDHWNEMSLDTVRLIEDVFKERGAKIRHLGHIDLLLRNYKYRELLEKAAAWSKRMDSGDRKAVRELIWGMAERNPRIMDLLEHYVERTNGIAGLLREVQKIAYEK